MNGTMLVLFAYFKMTKENFRPCTIRVRDPSSPLFFREMAWCDGENMGLGVREARVRFPALLHAGCVSSIKTFDLKLNSLNCRPKRIYHLDYCENQVR